MLKRARVAGLAVHEFVSPVSTRSQTTSIVVRSKGNSATVACSRRFFISV
jgi:hypothetical protein